MCERTLVIYTVCTHPDWTEEMYLEEALTSQLKDCATYDSYIVKYPDNKEMWEARLKETENKEYTISDFDTHAKLQRDHFINLPVHELSLKGITRFHVYIKRKSNVSSISYLSELSNSFTCVY